MVSTPFQAVSSGLKAAIEPPSKSPKPRSSPCAVGGGGGGGSFRLRLCASAWCVYRLSHSHSHPYRPAEHLEGVTEMHPGNYFVYDNMQYLKALLPSPGPDLCAFSLHLPPPSHTPFSMDPSAPSLPPLPAHLSLLPSAEFRVTMIPTVSLRRATALKALSPRAC